MPHALDTSHFWLQIVKNKCAAPYKLAEFDILFGSGISSEGCTLDAAEAVGVISRKGSWYRCAFCKQTYCCQSIRDVCMCPCHHDLRIWTKRDTATVVTNCEDAWFFLHHLCN